MSGKQESPVPRILLAKKLLTNRQINQSFINSNRKKHIILLRAGPFSLDFSSPYQATDVTTQWLSKPLYRRRGLDPQAI